MNALVVYISIQSGLSADHPVHKDLTRCKSYLQKIKDLEGESLNINGKEFLHYTVLFTIFIDRES